MAAGRHLIGSSLIRETKNRRSPEENSKMRSRERERAGGRVFLLCWFLSLEDQTRGRVVWL